MNNTFIDNAEDLDIVMPMYNLLEYSDKYSKIIHHHFIQNNDANNYRINNKKNNNKK